MNTVSLDPWNLDPPSHPPAGEQDRLMLALQYAILAPSIHNTQPWLFDVGERDIYFYPDHHRTLHCVDPRGRELYISCGAALFHLQIALRYFGSVPRVDYLDPGTAGPLARISLDGEAPPSDDESRLFHAITRRATYRGPFDDLPVSPELLETLRTGWNAEGLELALVTNPDARRKLGMLVAEADMVQWSDTDYRDELARWIRPRETLRQDGIPASFLGLPEALDNLGSIVAETVRTFDLGDSRSARDEAFIAGAPVLLCIATEADELRDWLIAGQTLSWLLLRATEATLGVAYLNQPIQVPTFRARIPELLNLRGQPQILLRMGYGGSGRHTPRRPVWEVLKRPPAHPHPGTTHA